MLAIICSNPDVINDTNSSQPPSSSAPPLISLLSLLCVLNRSGIPKEMELWAGASGAGGCTFLGEEEGDGAGRRVAREEAVALGGWFSLLLVVVLRALSLPPVVSMGEVDSMEEELEGLLVLGVGGTAADEEFILLFVALLPTPDLSKTFFL